MIESEGTQQLFQQFIDVWIAPEIQSRNNRGILSDDFVLAKAQVLFSLDEQKPIIRLNDEVQLIAQVKLRKSVEKGQPVYESAVEQVSQLRLTDDEEPKYAHISAIKIRDNWFLMFDLRYNKGLAREHLKTAKMFYESAKLALQHKLFAPFVNNLFSAIELTVKGELLLIPDEQVYKKGRHKTIQKKYNRFINLGNAKPDFKTALNKLSGLRNSTRYLKPGFHLTDNKAKRFLNTAEDMVVWLEKKVKEQ
jgi:HEPN domain-containing protein